MKVSWELRRLQLATTDPAEVQMLQEARADITSVTCADQVDVGESLDAGLVTVKADGHDKAGSYIGVALAR